MTAGVLQPRDLRIIDSSFTASRDPSFLVRQYCILINLMPVRAIIVPGKVYFFPREGADSELQVGCQLRSRRVLLYHSRLCVVQSVVVRVVVLWVTCCCS